jgi:NADPH:quinone reductase-like Zn-dependent oxidoreductase
MRALILENFDAPLQVAEIEQPEPAEGEVRVRVRTSSINGFDVFVASGMARAYTEYRFPVVIGKDFAGTVDAVGEGVTQYAVGEPVFGVVSKPDLHDGAYGEFVTVIVSLGLAKLPDGVSFEAAGAVGLAGTAALDSLDSAEVGSSDTVLVSGATGGVGAFAVQLAKGRDARVIATAHGDRAAAFVRDLGADAVVDYEGDLAAAVREEASDGVDVVIHAAGDAEQLVGLLEPGGRIASTIGYNQEQAGGRDVVVTAVAATATSETLDTLAAALAAGTLRVPIQNTYSLDDVPAGIADFGVHKVGKLAVSVAGDDG